MAAGMGAPPNAVTRLEPTGGTDGLGGPAAGGILTVGLRSASRMNEEDIRSMFTRLRIPTSTHILVLLVIICGQPFVQSAEPSARFKRFDKDGDGKPEPLTPEERARQIRLSEQAVAAYCPQATE